METADDAMREATDRAAETFRFHGADLCAVQLRPGILQEAFAALDLRLPVRELVMLKPPQCPVDLRGRLLKGKPDGRPELGKGISRIAQSIE